MKVDMRTFLWFEKVWCILKLPMKGSFCSCSKERDGLESCWKLFIGKWGWGGGVGGIIRFGCSPWTQQLGSGLPHFNSLIVQTQPKELACILLYFVRCFQFGPEDYFETCKWYETSSWDQASPIFALWFYLCNVLRPENRASYPWPKIMRTMMHQLLTLDGSRTCLDGYKFILKVGVDGSVLLW